MRSVLSTVFVAALLSSQALALPFDIEEDLITDIAGRSSSDTTFSGDNDVTISGVDSAGFGSAFQPETTFVGTTSQGFGSDQPTIVTDGGEPTPSDDASDGTPPESAGTSSAATAGAPSSTGSPAAAGSAGGSPPNSQRPISGGAAATGAGSLTQANTLGLVFAGVVMVTLL